MFAISDGGFCVSSSSGGLRIKRVIKGNADKLITYRSTDFLGQTTAQ